MDDTTHPWLGDDFAPVDKTTWRAQIDKDLKGAPYDKRLVSVADQGMRIEPLYTQDERRPETLNEWPGQGSLRRGAHPLGQSTRGWQRRQRHSARTPAKANADILRDLTRGIDAIALRFDDAVRSGQDDAHTDASDPNGVAAHSAAALARTLDGVWLNGATVSLEAGVSALPAAAAFLAVAKDQGTATDTLRADFNLDPVGALARYGVAPGGLDQSLADMARLAAWCERSGPGLRAVRVDMSVWHEAGADRVQALAAGLSTAVAYLRAMESAGLNIEAACAQLVFHHALDVDFFEEIAALRAARVLWARVQQACGVARPSMFQVAELGHRAQTRRDPWVNMLRNTAAVFAGAVGGVNAVISAPFDGLHGPSGDLGRRVARNTNVILAEESHLHRVIDPAGGSYFIEARTDAIAAAAWDHFQRLEAQGGVTRLDALRDLAARVEATSQERARAVAKRKRPIVGVSAFPNLGEAPLPEDADLTHEADTHSQPSNDGAPSLPGRDQAQWIDVLIDAAATTSLKGLREAIVAGRDDTTLPDCFPTRRVATPWEHLRDRSDAWLAQAQARPRIFSANLGPMARHKARATFASNLLQAGGFEVIDAGGFDSTEAVAIAFEASDADAAVLCGAESDYDAMGEAAFKALREAGADACLVAGRPGDREALWRAAGMTDALYLGCDALALLERLWTHIDATKAEVTT